MIRQTRKAETAADRLAEALGVTVAKSGRSVTLSHPSWPKPFEITESYRNVRFGRALAFLFRWSFHTLFWHKDMYHDVTGFIGSPASSGLAGHERTNLLAMVPERFKR